MAKASMPNIHVPESGEPAIEVLNIKVSLEEAAFGSRFDEDGSALVIHAGADDYESQPSGDARDLIACRVMEGRRVQTRLAMRGLPGLRGSWRQFHIEPMGG